MKKSNKFALVAFICLLFASCTSEDLNNFGNASDVLDVVFVDSNGSITKSGDKQNQVLSFSTEAQYNDFIQKVRSLSKAERMQFFESIGFNNLVKISEEADKELDYIGDNSKSVEDFAAQYASYTKKYNDVLVPNKFDSSDLSLYIPSSVDDDINPFIVGKRKQIAIDGHLRNISFSDDMNSTDKDLFAKEHTVIDADKVAKLKSRGSVSTPESEWPVNGFIEKRGSKKTVFSFYTSGTDVKFHFGTQKKMWYGWKRDHDRHIFFRTKNLSGFKLNYNKLELQCTGEPVKIPGGGATYPATYWFPSPNEQFAYVSNNDYKFGDVNPLPIPALYGTITGKFYIWTDMMTGGDMHYDLKPVFMPILDEANCFPCRIELTYTH